MSSKKERKKSLDPDKDRFSKNEKNSPFIQFSSKDLMKTVNIGKQEIEEENSQQDKKEQEKDNNLSTIKSKSGKAFVIKAKKYKENEIIKGFYQQERFDFNIQIQSLPNINKKKGQKQLNTNIKIEQETHIDLLSEGYHPNLEIPQQNLTRKTSFPFQKRTNSKHSKNLKPLRIVKKFDDQFDQSFLRLSKKSYKIDDDLNSDFKVPQLKSEQITKVSQLIQSNIPTNQIPEAKIRKLSFDQIETSPIKQVIKEDNSDLFDDDQDQEMPQQAKIEVIVKPKEQNEDSLSIKSEEQKSEKSSNSIGTHKNSSLLSDDAEIPEPDDLSHSELSGGHSSHMDSNQSNSEALFEVRKPRHQSIMRDMREILLSPFNFQFGNLHYSQWTELGLHKFCSHIILIFSIILFVIYKFKFRDDSLKKKTKWNPFLTSEENGFLLGIDVEGPKIYLFFNTVFMNNFSISKKLSHNDLYIYNLEQFKFQYKAIFARKPVKKIWRNGVSKFLRIAVTKVIMKYQLPNLDDIIFVMIICFHQLCFLYYAQMNNENNYLRYISESDTLTMIQKFIKIYSKGLSLLVKVNQKFIFKESSLSFRIVEFLFRMQLAQGLKTYFTHWSTKKEQKNIARYHDQIQQQFYRVSFPTLILYFTVILFDKFIMESDSNFLPILILNTKIGREWCILIFEKAYIVYFIHKYYIIKQSNKNFKKKQKLLKHKMKNKDDGNLSFESSNELKIRTNIETSDILEIDSFSESDFGRRKKPEKQSSGSGSGGSTAAEKEGSKKTAKRAPAQSKQLKMKQLRGLKSHLALNEVKLRLKDKLRNKHNRQSHNIHAYISNAFQNKSANIEQYNQAKIPKITFKMNHYMNSSSLGTIEEEAKSQSAHSSLTE